MINDTGLRCNPCEVKCAPSAPVWLSAVSRARRSCGAAVSHHALERGPNLPASQRVAFIHVPALARSQSRTSRTAASRATHPNGVGKHELPWLFVAR